MNLEDLHAFSVFADLANLTHAAEKLDISQPALYVKVKKMAEDLGVPLYEKVGRHLIMTEQGEEFARFCKSTLRSRDSFLAQLKGEADSQPVTLAAGAGSYLYLLGPSLQSFRKNRKSPLNLLTAKREQAISHLRAGRCDLAVTVLSSVPKGLRAELLCSIPCKLVMPVGHRLAKKKFIQLTSLDGLSLIVPPSGSPFREILNTYLKQAGVSWEAPLEATGWQLMMHFTKLGMGLSLVNGCCEVPAGCVAVPVRGLPSADYYLLSLKGNRPNPNVGFLRESILKGKPNFPT